MTEAAQTAIADAGKLQHNQYSRPGGLPMLVEAVRDVYQPLLGRDIDASDEVAVCSGAQEGIFNILMAFVNKGDEILCVEPYFDVYRKSADLLGIATVGVPLRLAARASRDGDDGSRRRSAGDFKLDLAELDAAVTPRTRLLVLNTPHNPTGKVFSRDELEGIAGVVRRHPQLLVLSDEVYEFMCFDGLQHHRFATLEGMWERTISLFSAGKSFSCTGWRVGYSIGPAALVQPLQQTQGTISFCSPTPLQVAVAVALRRAEEEGYFVALAASLQAKRDALCGALADAGMPPIVPQGGYFVLADTGGLGGAEMDLESDRDEPKDVMMNRRLTRDIGITGIPTSGFYSSHNRHLSDDVLRYAYCKTNSQIAKAADNLKPRSLEE